MPQVITLGETMLRLSPADVSTIEEADKFNVHIAGAESNVAVGLARMGINTGWVSKLVDNSVGRLIGNKIRQHNVDISKVVWAEEGRNGTFYLEFGFEPRPTRVIYDRVNSAFTKLTEQEIDWEYITGSELVHLTGITPALGENCEQLVHAVIDRAKKADCRISFDVNYRSKLWTPDVAGEKLSAILKKVDILICSYNDAVTLFKLSDLKPEEVAKKLYDTYNNEIVVVTMGEDGALAFDGVNIIRECAFKTNIIDRIGRGDSFTAGFIYGYLTQDVQAGLRYGNAMAALKQTIKGDFFWCSKDVVDDLVSGRIGKLER